MLTCIFCVKPPGQSLLCSQVYIALSNNVICLSVRLPVCAMPLWQKRCVLGINIWLLYNTDRKHHLLSPCWKSNSVSVDLWLPEVAETVLTFKQLRRQ